MALGLKGFGVMFAIKHHPPWAVEAPAQSTQHQHLPSQSSNDMLEGFLNRALLGFNPKPAIGLKPRVGRLFCRGAVLLHTSVMM